MKTFAEILAIFALGAALLPLLAFCAILLLSKRSNGAWLSVTGISLSFLFSAFLFLQIWNQEPIHFQADWFAIGRTKFSAGILLNNLSVLMLLLVSFVSLLVHIYSVAYMKGDALINRYWAYLGLFCFSMMSLVIADNLLLIYMFWELVGFSSYLLIGFWFTRDIASQAAKKAFVVNRIGDLGFLAGIMILFAQFRTLDILKLFGSDGLVKAATIQNGLWLSGIHHMPEVWLSVAGICLLFGAIAKSAQFPLHTWLPDAMEGPTAVSSLIHAATMVAAGVFLLVLVFPLFTPLVLDIITGVGIFTAFMAATIALAQNDIKRILAYSTISQLGFMMLAIGTGATGAAIFHLSTHAFFKCLLFLAAGAVIHQMHHFKDKHQLDFDHQDIRNMGGLRTYMPVTFVVMLIAALALAGIPFTSGYLSKDAILVHVFEWSSSRTGAAVFVPYLAMITSWLTTFYIARLIFNVFFGGFKWDNGSADIHEAPATIKIPMLILAACCLFAFFSFNPFGFEHAWIPAGLSNAVDTYRSGYLHILIPVTVSTISLLVIGYAWFRYKGMQPKGKSFLIHFFANGWYFNQLYNAVFVEPLLRIAGFVKSFDKLIIDGIVNGAGALGIGLSVVARWFDEYVVDAFVNLLGSVSKSIGSFTRQFQSGRLQHYLVAMLMVVLTFFIVKYFSQAI